MTVEIIVDPEKPDPDELDKVRGLLQEGGVGVVPTDTVYGIVAMATHRSSSGCEFSAC